MALSFYARTIEETLKNFESGVEGLSETAVPKLREKYGENVLPHKKRSRWLLFFRQFNNVLVYILLGALALSIALPFIEKTPMTFESFLDAIVILVILLLNAILGFVQEYRAEETISAMKKLASPQVRVRRDDKEAIIPSRELVPGDIVIVDTGDRISADGRLIMTSHFEVDESAMTGESLPAQKNTQQIKKDAPLADRKNMVFAGTLARGGSAEYVVTAIGPHTEIGKIAQMVAKTEVPETPLERKMKKLSGLIGLVVLVLCAAVVVGGIINGFTFLDLLLIVASLAVAAVPEGLPAVVTICFALGVGRMVKLNALVRKLDALETLGSVTVICSDKTGTITENRMKVIKSWAHPNFSKVEGENLMALAGASCNRAQLPDLGDPTELALLRYAEDKKVARHKIDDEEVPFSSENKYMQTRHADRVFLKGAPEKIFELVDGDKKDALEINHEMASKGLRVLAFAIKEKGDKRPLLVGLMGLEDPPRANVKAAIKQASDAGIRTVMITGDHAETARSVAHQVGIKGDVLTGVELDALTFKDLQEQVKTVSIYARVSPVHKLAIMEALAANSQIVAMTGDGVNDAPALKGAHVGVAMGKNGTEVAREAASMVLLDDDYATIVPAIREGRRIYDNIRKFLLFLLQSNFYEILMIAVSIFAGLPLPYLPIHLLWINLMTDSFPALAMGVEKAEPNVMRRAPRSVKEHILSGEWGKFFFLAVFTFAVTFAYYIHQIKSGANMEEARTTLLMLAIVLELAMALSIRSRQPLFKAGFFSNRWMIFAVVFTFLMQFLILYTPLGKFFHTVPISVNAWIQIVFFGVGMFVFFEVMKVVGLALGRRRTL